MCGICGILDYSGKQVDEKLINIMRDTMVHRGPDDAGTYMSADGRVGFGHRRLSIIDLSSHGHQPMSNEDGSIWITYNGEIYNHSELKGDLKAKGHSFKSETDTEIIIHLYEEEGIECIHKFRGMFAFALWDSKKEILYLVRDRIGIKPLYYTTNNGMLLFASEIKALLASPQVPRKVNEEAFFHYLSFLTTPAPHTLFDGVMKLPGGCMLIISKDGSMRQERYWDVFDNTKPLTDATEDEISKMILSELRTSVRYRKVSDVPVGIFLSGGIDSSTNAALFSEGETKKVKTFSIGYAGEYKTYANEFEYAQRMADFVGSEHFEKRLTVDEVVDFLPKMIYHQDEPIADPVCVPVYYVSKLARDNGVIVCQVGEGSDELFWGYQGWKRMLELEELNALPIPRILMKIALTYMKLSGKAETRPYEWLRRAANGLPVFWGGAEAFTEEEKKRLLHPRLREKFKGKTSYDAILPIRERYNRGAWERKPLSWMSYVDLNMRLPELLLMRVDKMSMAVSLEARVPFLDHKFVELSMSIPQEAKTRNRELKHILKKAVRGLIPDDIIDRKKQGFGVPVDEMLLERLGEYTNKKISQFMERTDYFDKGKVAELMRQKDNRVWFILNFILWHEMWIEGKPIQAGR